MDIFLSLSVYPEKICPINLNRRGEFNIYSMEIEFSNFENCNDCEWCGINGKY